MNALVTHFMLSLLRKFALNFSFVDATNKCSSIKVGHTRTQTQPMHALGQCSAQYCSNSQRLRTGRFYWLSNLSALHAFPVSWNDSNVTCVGCQSDTKWRQRSLPVDVLAYEEMDVGLHVSCVWAECGYAAAGRGLFSWAGVGQRLQRFLGHAANPGVGGGGRGGLRGLPFGGVQMVPLQLWRHEGDTETECSSRIKRQNGGLRAIVSRGESAALLLLC